MSSNETRIVDDVDMKLCNSRSSLFMSQLWRASVKRNWIKCYVDERTRERKSAIHCFATMSEGAVRKRNVNRRKGLRKREEVFPLVIKDLERVRGVRVRACRYFSPPRLYRFVKNSLPFLHGLFLFFILRFPIVKWKFFPLDIEFSFCTESAVFLQFFLGVFFL